MHHSARILLLLLALGSAVSHSAEPRLSAVGFGPVRFGMSPEMAGKQLGVPLVKTQGHYQDDRYVVIPGHRYAGISFTVSAAGKIDGVYVASDSPRFKTDKNLRIGSSANEIWRRYRSKIDVKAYQCGDAFMVYTYRAADEPIYGIEYTVDASGLVEGIMAGDLKTASPPC